MRFLFNKKDKSVQIAGIKEHVDEVDTLPTLLGSPPAKSRRLRKYNRLSGEPPSKRRRQTPSSDDILSLKQSPSSSMADMVLDPNHYTLLLAAAAAERDAATHTSGHSRTDSLTVPPSTPFSDDSMRLKQSNQGKENKTTDALMDGITYDTILTSNLKKALGMGHQYEIPSVTRTPPNSPIVTGGFNSLMGVSLAIMEGRV